MNEDTHSLRVPVAQAEAAGKKGNVEEADAVLAALGCGSGGDECEMLFVQQGAGVSSSETQLT